MNTLKFKQGDLILVGEEAVYLFVTRLYRKEVPLLAIRLNDKRAGIPVITEAGGAPGHGSFSEWEDAHVIGNVSNLFSDLCDNIISKVEGAK